MTTDKHEVLLRMRAIELLAYWEGRLVTNRLMSWFGLSRQQASADIKRYNTLYNPDALMICAELAGDFHLGYARQLTDKSSLLFDLAF